MSEADVMSELDRAESLRARLADAIRKHGAGQLAEAEAVYRDILQRDPNHVDALNLLGAVALAAGFLDEAEQLTARAVDLAPERAEFYNNLGNILLAARRPAEAETCLLRGLELNPNSPECHSNLGLALSAQGRFGDATEAFRRALALRPGAPEILGNLGIALKAQGWLDEAIDAFVESGKAGGFDPDLMAHLLLALNQAGRTEEAIARAEVAFPECRYSAIFRNAFGRILLDGGLPVRASHLFRGALGIVADFAEARSNVERARARIPDDSALHEALFRSVANGAVKLVLDLQPLRAMRSPLVTETINNAMLLAMVAGSASMLAFLPIASAVWGLTAIVVVYFGFGGMVAESILRARVNHRIMADPKQWTDCWAAGALTLKSGSGKHELASPKDDWRLAAEDSARFNSGSLFLQ